MDILPLFSKPIFVDYISLDTKELSEKLGKESEQIQKEREVLKNSKRNCKGFMI